MELLRENPILWVFLAAAVLLLVLSVIHHRKNRRLFDRRKENICFVRELLDNYHSCAGTLQRNRGVSFDMGAAGDYELMTAPECMAEIREFLNSPFSDSEHVAFDEKMSEMERRADEIAKLFPTRMASPMCHFLRIYRDTLRNLVEYQTFLRRKNQNFSRICATPMSDEERILFFRNGEPRMELLRNMTDLKFAANELICNEIVSQAQKKFRLYDR